jgi:hypothetical protein
MQLHHKAIHHAKQLVSRVRERYDAETLGAALIVLVLVAGLAYQLGLNAGREDGLGVKKAQEAGGIPTNAQGMPQFDIFITATSTEPIVLPVFAPKAAEVIQRGTTYELKWKGIGYEGYAAADITLIPTEGKQTPIRVNDLTAFVDIATGVYKWEVPADIKPGNYAVSIEITRIFEKSDTPTVIATGKSAAFIITK